MQKNWLGIVAFALCVGHGLVVMQNATAQPHPGALIQEGRSYALHDNIVSTSVFLWYSPAGGQLSGAWEPLGGRPSWTGEVPFWKDTVKQIMSANIDVMNVHLIAEAASNGYAFQRENLFQAMSELRHEGYDVPKVTPFLDPIITWGTNQSINVATTAGKDAFVSVYEDFFDQYYSRNTDTFADSYLTNIDNRVVLDTWHTHLSLQNAASLSRADIESRLQARYGAEHAIFNEGVRMIATENNGLSFEDEQVIQFQSQAYYDPTTFNGLQSVQLKPGYWDQNIRNPGTLLPRAGGTHYVNAWDQVVANKDIGIGIDRVYIESWNEYDESSGIYPAEGAQPPIISGPNPGSPSDDDWSSSDDPYEYVNTTADGARQFNDVVDHDATILWHNIPDSMRPGETFLARVIVRNDGDISWTGAANYKLGQNELTDAAVFGSGRTTIDDTSNEIPTYGGVFRGRPIEFHVEVTAPLQQAAYNNHWQMLQEGNVRFGEELAHTITVSSAASLNNILFNGDFEVDPEGTVAGGTNVIDTASIAGWRAFGVGDATGTATVTSAAGKNGKGIELVRTAPVGLDSAFDKDSPSLREAILAEERIYKLTVDARDGSQFGGTPAVGLGIQFADVAFNRGAGFDPGANFETFGLTARSDTGERVSVRFDVGGVPDRSVHLDNATLVDVTTGVNRLINGGFENSDTHLPNWRFFDVIAPTGSATLSSDANSGNSAVLLDVMLDPLADIGLDLEPVRVATIAGEELTLSLASKNVLTATSDTRLRVSVTGFDEFNTPTEIFAELINPETIAYENFSFDFTVPADVDFINVAFRVWDEALGNASIGSYLIDDVSVLREVAGLLGDFDGDGDVDGSDFLQWQRDGLSATDLIDWQTGFGTPTLSEVTAVPEPSSLLIGIFALVHVYRGSCRRVADK